jgi:hypothetical protein
MEWDAEVDEGWPKAYSLLAEDFVSKVMRKKGILLDYKRDTLRVVKEYVRKEFRALRKASQEVTGLSIGASAYLSKVIVLNFGGEPVFYPGIGNAVVRDVAGLGIMVFPNVWLNRAIHARPPVKLEDYYDKVVWLVNRLKTNSLNMDEKRLWLILRISSIFHHASIAKDPLKDENLACTMISFSLCPSCNGVGRIAGFCFPYDLLTDLAELVRNIWISAFEPARRPCEKCKGPCLPLGYSYSTVITKEGLEKSFFKELLSPLLPGSGGILTFVVSSLRKGFILFSPLEKDSESSIHKAGRTKEFPLVGPEALLMFSSTPFCV